MSRPPPPTAEIPATDEITSAFVIRATRVFLAVGFVAALSYGLAILLLVPEQSGRLLGPLGAMLVLLAVWLLLKAGRLRLAALLLGWGIWLVATVSGALIAGVTTPILVLYPAVVVFMAWAFSLRAAIGFAIASALALFAMAFAEHAGWLQVAPTPPTMFAVAQAVMLAVITVLVVHMAHANHAQVSRQQGLAEAIAARGRELDASRAELARAQAIGHVGSWGYDIDRDMMRLSDEACRIFGLPPGSRGSHAIFLARSHEADRDLLQAAWNAALAGAGFDHEHRVRIGDEVRWIRQIAEFERDSGGRARSAVGVTQDITERKEFEQRLQEHQARLEREVSVRTRELAAARDAAEAASLAKSAFLANVSHEIRTPMNAIAGLAFLLRKEAATPEQADRLSKIDAAAQQLLGVINDILDIARSEAGLLLPELADFSLGALLEQVRGLVGEPARLKGIDLDIDSEGVPSWLRGDPARLRQALFNYASNAVKFTERGTITIRVRQLAEGGEGLHLRFEVEDSGIGIAAAELGRLFRPFEQVDGSATRRHGGAGLGLVITRRLAELMGGEVGADSTPGKGSRFWFTARLQRGRGSVPVAAPGAADGAAELRRRHAGARILVAEDNEINREVVHDLIASAGLTAEFAPDGLAALEMARQRDYALILMDLQMPRLDGIDAARAILALPGHAATPILAVTANALDEDRRACAEAGMKDFIAKPVAPETLYAAMLKWLPPTRPAPPLPPATSGTGGAAADPGLRQRLDAVAGLDAAQGLGMLRGNLAKYAQLLRLFVDSNEATATQLADAAAAGDAEAVRRSAHKLKGSAGAIGAPALARVAAELNSALRANAAQVDLPAAAAALAAQLDALRAELGRALD